MDNITDKDELDICIKTVKGKKEVYIGGAHIDRFKLLASVCNVESKKDAWKLLDVISKTFHPLDDETFNTLYGAVAMYTSIRFAKNELSYHLLFEKNYSKIREGKIVKKKTDGLNIPDLWVEKGDHIIPVEIKLKSFDKAALKQLKRYMIAYKSKYGIASAEKLTVDLPENIEFIPFSELENVD